MKNMKATLLLMLSVVISAETYASTACAQYGNEVGMVGLDSGGTEGLVYANVTSTSTKDCGCASVRFHPDRTNTDKALSILLAAKLAGKKVRVDIQEEGNCNTAYRVYMQ